MFSRKSHRRAWLTGAALAAMLSTTAMAQTAPVDFQIAAGDLGAALGDYAKQSGVEIFYQSRTVEGRRTDGLTGTYVPRAGLDHLLAGTGLVIAMDSSGALVVREGGSGPQSASAGGDVEALIVTAQKKEENIQDVPIAISAFSAQALEAQKIEGGFDLLKAIPNVTFSKNNFSSYNFSIRGVGTKAISISTDPGVAVAFNSSALIRNRLFEQEYFDVERVEVLRGPQGTLYGRNATAGVINVISATPRYGEYEAMLKGEVGNYDARRVSGMMNIPLVDDVLAVRFAGAWTKREGYDFNDTTQNAINGRDLWSGRMTLGLRPNDAVNVNLIWEHFEEDDNRSRTGKQLCHRDQGLIELGGVVLNPGAQGHVSQGCKAGSLYDDNAFGTPNGLSIPFMQVGVDTSFSVIGIGPTVSTWISPLKLFTDPYGGMMQSRDLRRINSVRDPKYRATTDVLELNMDFDIGDHLTLTSQSAYVQDKIYSFQDFNRFNTYPVFNDSLPLTRHINKTTNPFQNMLANGIYCDPQLGCSDTVAGFDISRARSKQFGQEFRLQSSFDGPVNFSAGLNFTRYKTEEDYFVFYNLFTLIAQMGGGINLFNASPDITTCMPRNTAGFGNPNLPLVPIDSPEGKGCIYIDPNPIESINGEGHNYFRSKNPYRLKSYAGFGEVYWEATDNLKITAGLRYTIDRKIFIPVPSQALLSTSGNLGGMSDRGYPQRPAIKQGWEEFSGRLGVDWKPDLGFTDETMFYAFYSRGYKGGGANPPGIGYRDYRIDTFPFNPVVQTLPYPKVFEPEFVDAYEVGAKNTLLQGAMTLNVGAFYYDYTDYQVSQIKERTAVNENFDAKIWGLEIESLFVPSKNLRLNWTFGYQNSEIADGEQSIDLMNRTQGDPDLVVVKPYVIQTSNCVVDRAKLIATLGNNINQFSRYNSICGGLFANPLNPLDGPNGGQGVFAELGGNKLPNAPHWTTSLGAQYTVDVTSNWRAVVRGDAYWQSQSWARVYNAVNDKLHGWYNMNLSLWLENDNGLKIELYAKNLLDKTPITDAFLNSDDTALTTNVFVLDPRLIGLSVRKEF